jgi:hypothetical protein
MTDEPITKAYLEDALKKSTETIVSRILSKVALEEDLQAVKDDVTQVKASVSNMTSGLDQYLKNTEDWKQEQTILRTQQGKIKQALIRKGIASEQELAA